MSRIGYSGAITVGAIPAGGNTGQLVAKTSSVDLATTWSGGITAEEPIYQSGKWYDNRVSVTVNTNVFGTNINLTYYIPVWINAAVSVNAIAVLNFGTANTAGNIGLAMSASTATGRPGALLSTVVNAATSTVDGAATTATFPAFAVPAGWNFFAMSIGASGTQYYSGSGFEAFRTPWGSTRTAGPTIYSTQVPCVLSSTGTVPTSNPTTTYDTNATRPPTVFFKVA